MFRKPGHPRHLPLRYGVFRRYGYARRVCQGTLLCIILWTLVETLFVHHRVSTVDSLQLQQQSSSRSSGSNDGSSGSSPTKERLFIASMHWNNEAILRSHWNDAVVELARTWGPENVYVSVYESGSWDNSKDALRDLDDRLGQLGVPRNITLSETTHEDEISVSEGVKGDGWIHTSRRKKELRRIPYLARLRNLTLRPLEHLTELGVAFDKVLFLNDVVFTVDDVIALLGTNNGVYGAACSMDYSKPPIYYDTFALRDSRGNEHVMQTWPYFRSAASRNALLALSPIPVKSCWNGIVAMPIDPFTSNPPLRFRALPDSLAEHHLEGSECCLIHADNPLSQTKGVYVNPMVRVGYNPAAYMAIHPVSAWISLQNVAFALWENRIRRWVTTHWLKKMAVGKKIAAWESEDSGRFEPGEFCIINEMQVLASNGWAHV